MSSVSYHIYSIHKKVPPWNLDIQQKYSMFCGPRLHYEHSGGKNAATVSWSDFIKLFQKHTFDVGRSIAYHICFSDMNMNSLDVKESATEVSWRLLTFSAKSFLLSSKTFPHCVGQLTNFLCLLYVKVKSEICLWGNYEQIKFRE